VQRHPKLIGLEEQERAD